MSHLENPTVLITRPIADAERFLAMLRAKAGAFEAVISPAFGFEEVSSKQTHFDKAVFTSKMGVSFAPAGKGRVAYCVGAATAQQAKNAGYSPISANGSADDLVELILSHAPSDTLQHIRGENSYGNVTDRLVAQGMDCSEVIAYRKVPLSPAPKTLEAVCSASKLIVPVFSAETVTIIANWNMSFEGCVVVAISETVALAAQALGPSKVVVSERPDMRGMAAATARLTA